MLKLFALVLAISVVVSGQNHQPSYGTNYQTGDHQRSETVDNQGNVQGKYSYVDPNGKTITVKYTAGKDGFKVQGDDLPVAPAAQQPGGYPQQPSYQQQPFGFHGQPQFNAQPQYNQYNPQPQLGQYNPQPQHNAPQPHLGQYNPQPQHNAPQPNQYNPQPHQYNPQPHQYNPQPHQYNPQQYNPPQPQHVPQQKPSYPQAAPQQLQPLNYHFNAQLPQQQHSPTTQFPASAFQQPAHRFGPSNQFGSLGQFGSQSPFGGPGVRNSNGGLEVSVSQTPGQGFNYHIRS